MHNFNEQLRYRYKRVPPPLAHVPSDATAKKWFLKLKSDLPKPVVRKCDSDYNKPGFIIASSDAKLKNTVC